jgi:hypothetical protein
MTIKEFIANENNESKNDLINMLEALLNEAMRELIVNRLFLDTFCEQTKINRKLTDKEFEYIKTLKVDIIVKGA